MMFTTLVSLLLLGFQATDPLPASWKVFSPKGSGFRVQLPDRPKESERTVETPEGAVNISMYSIERDGVAFLVTCFEPPAVAVAGNPKAVLDEARDAGVKNANGSLEEEKEIEQDGHPGREMTMELPDSRIRGGGIYRSRIDLIGRIHYLVAAVSSKTNDRPSQVKAFLESFHLEGDRTDSKGSP